MRKLISLGLLALFLSVFSSQLLAGGVQACDDMKEELQALGAYGLCIAWHNADEEDKDKFAKKFRDKAGFPVTDLTDLSCPCWDEAFLNDITVGLTGTLCSIDSFDDSYDFAIYQAGDLQVALSAGFVPRSPFEGTGCFVYVWGFDLGDGLESPLQFETDGDQDAVCSNVLIEAMQKENFDHDCGQWPDA